MNILSLFDGMSCGQIALNRVGIKYNNYYASEIDKYAIKVTQYNYPNTIQLGDITNIKGEVLPKIDLLIGGSPCQGFSLIGKQLNFDDIRSKLFFEYVRLVKECKPKFFLLENVCMKKEYKDIISKYLDVTPILINSSLVSAQNRKRLYWTNIPNIIQPIDKNIKFIDILDDNDFRELMPFISKKWGGISRIDKGMNWVLNDKSVCLTTKNTHSLQYILNNDKTKMRTLTPIECERLQTVPENYTNIVSNSQRYKMLGNGWTIDVICHIIKELNYV